MDVESEDIKPSVIQLNLQNQDLEVQKITQNVLEKCQLESTNCKLELPLHDYEGRTAFYTGVPKSVLLNLQQKKNIYEVNCQLFDVFERMVIMKTLLKCYLSNVFSATFENIYELVKESMTVENLNHFRYLMVKMGFDYRKTITGHILAEDMKYSYERLLYLKKIRQFKSDKKTIYYIDERVIDASLKFEKPDFARISDKEDATHLLDGLYFYHAFSAKGLESYLFTNKKCLETYNKWVFDVLLKLLLPGSLIVIDSHPIHGKLVNNTLTRYHSKSEMISWLRKNNISCAANMHKAELYELISKCRMPPADYDFDKLLKAHGFDVLRLPFGCNNLSPSPLLWKELATRIAPEINKFTPIELEDKITPAVTSLFWASWKKYGDRISYWEEQLIDIDTRIESALDEICEFDVTKLNAD